MSGRPLCKSRLPRNFIDAGTSNLNRSPSPKPMGVGGFYGGLERIYHPRTLPPSRKKVIEAATNFVTRDGVEGFLPYPYHPAVGSGITIGYGYDLKYHTKDNLATDWAELSENDLERLSTCCLKEGSATMAKELRDIVIPKKIAAEVAPNTVAKYYDKTLRVFPGVERLPVGVQVALTSIVFNRGNREILHKADKMTRWERTGVAPWMEMRFIQTAVRTGNLFDIYFDVRAMQRVWFDSPIEKNMRHRRELEADQILPYIPRYREYENDRREFSGKEIDWRDYLNY